MQHERSFWFLLVIAAIAAIVLASLLLRDLSGEAPVFKVDNFMLGTLVEIQAWDSKLDEESIRNSIQRAFDSIRAVENAMSVNIEGSFVQKINESAGGPPVAVSDPVISVIEEANRISELSDGAFDITIGAICHLWDSSSETGSRAPAPDVIAEGLLNVDYSRIEVSATEGVVRLPETGMWIDLGGLAKGYAIDAAAAALRNSGLTNFIVNGGGDMAIAGVRPNGGKWRIGVRHPRKPGEQICTIGLSDLAVVTSGDYERFFEFNGKRYHHIMDPKTGYPANKCQSVTIVAKEAMLADALATAVFVMGPDAGLRLIDSMPGIEALIVDAEGHNSHSNGFRRFLLDGPLKLQ
ncbi:MAG: FAD:protein FMN transferase [Candidatus Coatesbacteria bacterium]|nr:FAD:protein FMN transferase [Candidatus Coatesbacteria bacterium]